MAPIAFFSHQHASIAGTTAHPSRSRQCTALWRPSLPFEKNTPGRRCFCLGKPSPPRPLLFPLAEQERRLVKVFRRVTSTRTAQLRRRNRDKFRVALRRRPSGLHGDFASTRPIPGTVILESLKISRAPEIRYHYTHSKT